MDGFRIVPAMGLTAWLAFAPHGERTMLMGDLVLTETELPRVPKAAVESGLSVSAIHNHFLRDRPKVMFMHVGGVGHAGGDDAGVHKFVIGRPALTVRHGAATLDAFMGLNTWMAFQGTPERGARAPGTAPPAPRRPASSVLGGAGRGACGGRSCGRGASSSWRPPAS